MSDFDEKLPQDGTGGDLDGLSLDDLLRSAKEELARADRLIDEPPQETAGAPEDALETSQPRSRNEYAAPEQPVAEDDEQEHTHRARLSAPLKVLLYVCVVLFVSVGLAVGGWRCAQDVLALTKPDRKVTVTVEENMSIADLTQELHDKGLVDYPWLFKFYCWYSHAEDKIDPGTYELNNLYDYHALVNGMIASTGVRASVTLTIPEGYECKDIFALLEENGVCTAQALEEASASYEFDYDFLSDLPYGEKNRLEGYLFPDTYEFYLGEEPEEAIDRFLRNFDRKVTQDLRDQIDVLNEALAAQMAANDFTAEQIANSRLTLHDVITVASLVEKETARSSESANIASVIYNRLCSKLYPCLQIDATIQYALAERKEQLSNADKAIISPYNTYTNAGLPVGPIANPGLNSIRAALYPAQTDYYFYALGTDGVHKFSTTYYEHQEFLIAQGAQTDETPSDVPADTGDTATEGGNAEET